MSNVPSGIKISALADNVIARYDQNNDCKINRDGLKMSEERLNSGEQMFITNNGWETAKDFVRQDSINISNLLRAADKDKDNLVTKQEFIKLFNDFDDNKDGKLNLDERKELSKAYPEVKRTEIEKRIAVVENGYFHSVLPAPKVNTSEDVRKLTNIYSID